MIHAASNRNGRRRARAAALGLLIAAATATATATATAAEPVALRWRLEPGRVFRYAMVQETRFESKPDGGRGVRLDRRQQVDFRWTVGQVADGVAELTMDIERLRVRIDGEGPTAGFAFDSAADDPRPGGPFGDRLAALLKELAGSEIAFRMDARGEASDVRLPDPLRARIREAGDAGSAAFSEEGARNLILQALPLLPEGPVEPGAAWTRQTAAAMPRLGAIVLDKTYTLRGPRPDRPALREVDVETRVTLRPAPEADLEMRLIRQQGSGSFDFDTALGLVASYHLEDALTTEYSAHGQRVEQTLAGRIDVALAPPADAPCPDPSPR
ncbi:hypothetical protein [Paludisphaera soli]|uniref:hypothetical protein n=1 Tax=Paludisphaera soli TaxID=2712865 RepID=UPI0013EA058B|nr:hypothetical protein [Paludisphaera soli]